MALTYDQKNKILLAGAILLLISAWFMAFEKTVDAIRVNRELKRKETAKNDLAYNPVSTAGKLTASNMALNRFKVDPVEWKDEFWLKVSRVATQKDVDIIYEPANGDGQDPGMFLLQQSISFSGKYKDLMLLLDSIERLDGIGRIRSLEFLKNSKQGVESTAGNLLLTLQFYALNKTEGSSKK